MTFTTRRSGGVSKPFGDLDVDVADRQIDHRLAGDVDALVIAVAQIRAVIFEECRVRDTMTVERREVLARGAVQVQFDRHRTSRLAGEDPDLHPLIR